ncbi:RidA family protein [Govanella unica]|uniref:RidA family protein n=1 Tax=Govanella unica TaxID=2975056 RepID=A0A9X3TYK6_9PROT|nr:RidA family protein [Govania unica]MDA5194003.1 RidA family protein [Govania unica]
MQILLPAGWPRPKGYSNAIAAEGRVVFVGGQIGWDPLTNTFEQKDFLGQFRQTLETTKALLAEAGAGPEHMTRMTWYITDKRAYLDQAREVGAAYRDIMGKNFPVMAVVVVVALMEDEAMIEIETTAVLPKA